VKKDSKCTENGVRRDYEDCKFYKIKIIELKNCQCALCDEMAAVTQSYCCSWRFDGYHEVEFCLVYSQCAQKLCSSVMTIPSTLHHVCMALCGRHLYKDKLIKLIIPRYDYYIYLGTWIKLSHSFAKQCFRGHALNKMSQTLFICWMIH
jgi:hypothetical protein